MAPGEGLCAHKCFGPDSSVPYPFAFSDCFQGKAFLGAHRPQSGHFLFQSSGRHKVTE